MDFARRVSSHQAPRKRGRESRRSEQGRRGRHCRARSSPQERFDRGGKAGSAAGRTPGHPGYTRSEKAYWLPKGPANAFIDSGVSFDIATRGTFSFDLQRMAGDRPGYEEASRALFARDARRFAALIRGWPADVRRHLLLVVRGALQARRRS